MQDLIVLVADKNMEMAVRGLLSRPEALGIRPVTFEIVCHSQRDPGVRRNASAFLQPYRSDSRYALVMFDRQGCGDEEKTAQQLEAAVQDQLDQSGWRDRSVVIVLDPELEVWVFTASSHVVKVLAGGDGDLWGQVVARYGGGVGRKPERPKEAVEEVLQRRGIPRSSALYYQLATRVSLKGCQDPAFHKFREALRRWFPPGRLTGGGLEGGPGRSGPSSRRRRR